jgi:hypothetical protein
MSASAREQTPATVEQFEDATRRWANFVFGGDIARA